MNYKKWDDDEIKLLKAMSQFYTSKQVAEKLNRSPFSVRNKLRDLDIKLLNRGRIYVSKSSDWSASEIKILNKYVGKLSAQMIAKKLSGRSVKAIRLKVRSLGLSLFKTPWSSQDLDTLLSLREKGCSFRFIARQLGRTSGACRAKFNYLNP